LPEIGKEGGQPGDREGEVRFAIADVAAERDDCGGVRDLRRICVESVAVFSAA
jgi:hypothetical protein